MIHNNSRKGSAVTVILVVIVLAVVIGGVVFYVSRKSPGVGDEGTSASPTSRTPAAVVLNEQNNSSQSGMAMFTAYDDTLAVDAEGVLETVTVKKTKVTVALGGSAPGVMQPAHIHTGSCANLGGVKYPLTSVENGASETVLDASLEQLRKELPLAINVHKSSAEANIYVACGDVTADLLMGVDETVVIFEKVVTFTDAGYSPAVLTIKGGETVTFKNESSKQTWPASAMHPTHTVYPGSDIEKCGTPEEGNIFDACRGIAPGSEWSFTFLSSGEWKYHDHLNSGVFGTIVVQE